MQTYSKVLVNSPEPYKLRLKPDAVPAVEYWIGLECKFLMLDTRNVEQTKDVRMYT